MLKFCSYIPLEIQLEIIKRIPDVKSLLRFRAIAKPCKSFIDSREFIDFHGGVRHTQPHRLLFSYTNALDPSQNKYTCFVDDDNNDTFTQQQDCASTTLSTITKQYKDLRVIGSSRGLLCLHGLSISCGGEKVVLWNPCIPNPVVIAVPFAHDDIQSDYGFGVCPVTNDPIIVRIQYPDLDKPYSPIHKPWHVEVFTLSTGVWNALPCTNIPKNLNHFESLDFSFKGFESSQVVINRFIYWVASTVSQDDQGCWEEYFILSFDLIAKEFRVVADIKFSLKLDWGRQTLSISKLKESLVVFVSRAYVCDVYKMEPDSSFTKLFIINKPDVLTRRILGFRKNGEILMEATNVDEEFVALETYDPCKERISNIGIYGIGGSLVMSSYKETLLLLDHSDSSCVHPVINDD